MTTLSRDTGLCTEDKRYIPRGIRNNNPLNIRKGDKWQGLRDFPTDKEFCEFASMAMGFRAAWKTLDTYWTKHGCRTLAQVIHRWAPPAENSTWAYIMRVKRLAGMRDAHSPLRRPCCDYVMWSPIVLAMAMVECGLNDWQRLDASCRKGFHLAFD